MAQTAAALVMYTLGDEAHGKVVYFMSVDEARFRKPVVPGDTLKIHVARVRNRRSVWKFSGEARVDGTLVANATFSAMIMGYCCLESIRQPSSTLAPRAPTPANTAPPVSSAARCPWARGSAPS